MRAIKAHLHIVCIDVYNGDPVKSAELIKELKAAGWTLERVRGSHHQFKHPKNPMVITVPHPKKDLGVGLVAKIRKDAGL